MRRRRANHRHTSVAGPGRCHRCHMDEDHGRAADNQASYVAATSRRPHPTPLRHPPRRAGLPNTLNALRGMGSDPRHARVGIIERLIVITIPGVSHWVAQRQPTPQMHQPRFSLLAGCSSNTGLNTFRPSTNPRNCCNSSSSVATLDAFHRASLSSLSSVAFSRPA